MVNVVGKTWTLTFDEDELNGIIKEYFDELKNPSNTPHLWGFVRTLKEIDELEANQA
ncbi:hypothetical protein V7O66_13845 [Methanolobus sp. ZRKC3]|uniref:hypothetical protein n=1 Tax=Methanolobus sp. ZRKC3 TaxID=3125786 RepID=UPI0032485ABF